ncbi:MAG: RecQ family ATP-dependent DNA helicase, partial [Odoribacter sp.]
MKASIEDILKQYWGYDTFRSLQKEIILSVISGRDTLALMPTGGGKSITYQVPAMVMEGVCVVITPLIALMKDQVEELNIRNIPAEAIYTGMTAGQIESAINKTIGGKVKFLYISPERLTSEHFRLRLRQMQVSILAVDEAHCISQWGYDFRPSYLRIAEIREWFPQVPVLALTATATPQVAEDIQAQLKFAVPHVLSKSFRRDNISYVVRKVNDKLGELLHILSKLNACAIVYVRKR